MDRVSGRLIVYFEAPFWVGIFERVIDKKLSAAKVTFGAEPKDIEVLEFINRNYYHLHFSPEIETTVKETKKNPKRAQRDAKKQILETGIGTKSQQALKLQQEQNELPSPTTSEMVSTIPKQYSKARSQCHYSVGKNPSAYLQMLLDALVAPGTNTLYILRATGS